MVSEEEQTDIAAILPDISAEIVPSKPTVTKPVPSQGMMQELLLGRAQSI